MYLTKLLQFLVDEAPQTCYWGLAACCGVQKPLNYILHSILSAVKCLWNNREWDDGKVGDYRGMEGIAVVKVSLPCLNSVLHHLLFGATIVHNFELRLLKFGLHNVCFQDRGPTAATGSGAVWPSAKISRISARYWRSSWSLFSAHGQVDESGNNVDLWAAEDVGASGDWRRTIDRAIVNCSVAGRHWLSRLETSWCIVLAAKNERCRRLDPLTPKAKAFSAYTIWPLWVCLLIMVSIL